MNFTRYAKGRKRKVGQANKTERRYADVLALRKLANEVEWYRFEGLKVRLADGAFYTPDYAVMLADGTLECHEVKAGKLDKATGLIMMLCEEASKVRVKVAAEMYPIAFVFAVERPKKAGGGFDLIPVGPATQNER